MISFRQKIALFFTLIVTILFALFQYSSFLMWDNLWKSQKEQYLWTSITQSHSIDDVRDTVNHSRVFDAMGNVIFNQGIFTNPQIQIDGHNQFVQVWNRHFYTTTRKIGSMEVCYAQDVTEFINQRNSFLKTSFTIGLIGIIFTYFVGLIFAHIILKPIRDMYDKARHFSTKRSVYKIKKPWEKDDDIQKLSCELNNLFARVTQNTHRLEQFSADVSHEFKNKLFEMRTHLQLAKKRWDLSAGIQKIEEDIANMDTLIGSLILLSKDEHVPVEKKKVNIKEVVQKIADDQKRPITIDAHNSHHKVHPELFELALHNLITNAIKYTPKDGMISVVVRKDFVIVSDSGVGIADEDLEKIWNRFYKTDTSREYGTGFGLGLSIVKKIITEIHPFTIKVESKKNEWTEFQINFLA